MLIADSSTELDAVGVPRGRSFESASEAERRERFGLLASNISLMPNGTLDGFNRILDFDEGLTHVFRVTAIVFLRQSFRDVAAQWRGWRIASKNVAGSRGDRHYASL